MTAMDYKTKTCLDCAHNEVCEIKTEFNDRPCGGLHFVDKTNLDDVGGRACIELHLI